MNKQQFFNNPYHSRNKCQRAKSVGPCFQNYGNPMWGQGRRGRSVERETINHQPISMSHVGYQVESEYEKLRAKIEEFEQHQYEAELQIENAENEKNIEKERAEKAERENAELKCHIFQLQIIQKEKEAEFLDYKKTAEAFIEKADREKGDAIWYGEQVGKELISCRQSINILERKLRSHRFQDNKHNRTEIKRSKAIHRRFNEAIRHLEEKNDRLDQECMRLRKGASDAEMNFSVGYENIQSLLAKWKSEYDSRKLSKSEKKIVKKVIKDLKKTKKILTPLKNCLPGNSQESSDQSERNKTADIFAEKNVVHCSTTCSSSSISSQ